MNKNDKQTIIAEIERLISNPPLDEEYNPAYQYGLRTIRNFISSLPTEDYPMPEDTVIFQKGVAEGRRLEREEQKPDTRTTDDLQLLGFIYDLLVSLEWREDYAMSKDECLRRLNDYRPQKPAEWSEEDIKRLYSIGTQIGFLKGKYSEYQKDIDWLYALADKMGFHKCKIGEVVTEWKKEDIDDKMLSKPKEEWSEDDEDIRQSIIKDIKWERANTPVTVDKDIRKYDKQINWLKSLRPSWKPSEEQMKALQNAVALTACDKELVRLYNQLKKL
ncbi:MAG: hypothetical protein J5658_03880 [Prevotella sp.]|nr:hypothetical protein [Prevotella sp.]